MPFFMVLVILIITGLIHHIFYHTFICHQIIPYVPYQRFIIVIHHCVKITSINRMDLWGDKACVQAPNQTNKACILWGLS